MKTLFLAMALATSAAQAITIDPIFDAYAEGPGGVVAISSKQPCSISSKAKEGWKRARVYRGEGDSGLDACWFNKAEPFKNAVSICKVYSQFSEEFAGCAPTAKSEFLETRSLPKRARIQ